MLSISHHGNTRKGRSRLANADHDGRVPIRSEAGLAFLSEPEGHEGDRLPATPISFSVSAARYACPEVAPARRSNCWVPHSALG